MNPLGHCFHCQKVPIQLWIKLQQNNSQSNQTIEKLKRYLNQNLTYQNKKRNFNFNEQRQLGQQRQTRLKEQFQNRLKQTPQGSQTYISPIFSLQFFKNTQRNKKQKSNKPKRLLYHNYTKFTTVPYNYSKLYLPKEHNSMIVLELTNRIYNTVIDVKNEKINKYQIDQNQKQTSNQNFCFISFGSKQSQIQNLIQGNNMNQGIFYGTIVKLNDMINKLNQSNSKKSQKSQNQIRNVRITINFLAIADSKIIDLLNIGNCNIFLKDQQQRSNRNKSYNPFISPMRFQGATQYQFESNYQLYTTFKKVFFKRKQLALWNILLVNINFYIQYSNNTFHKTYNNSALLVEWSKNNLNIYSDNTKTADSQKPLFSLNQCILEIFKFIENKSGKEKQKNQRQEGYDQNINQNIFKKSQIQKLSNIQSFRNSLITRILKPYLLFNSKVIFMGCCSINQENQNDTYQTLMLGKHVSKLFSFKKIKQIGNFIPKMKFIESFDNRSQNDSEIIQKRNRKQSSPKNNRNREIVSYGKQRSKRQAAQIKSPSLHTVTPSLQLQDQKVVRNKLLSLLQQIKDKQSLNPENQYNQLSKNMIEQKSKIFKTKKQLNILKVKSLTKNIRKQIFHGKIQQNQEINHMQRECSRLQYQEKKIQKQLDKINVQLKAKFFNQNNAEGKNKQKIQIQKLKVLKNHLKNQLQITQLEINSFLQQKQCIKQVYQNQIGIINKQEKGLLKKIKLMKEKDIDNPQNYRSLQTSPYRKRDRNQKNIRFINQMKPYLNQINRNIEKFSFKSPSLNKKNNPGQNFQALNILKYINKFPSSNMKNNESMNNNKRKLKTQAINDVFTAQKSFQEINIEKLKKSRQLIRKKEVLRQKVARGRVDYSIFLDQTTKKYQNYQIKRKDSTK